MMDREDMRKVAAIADMVTGITLECAANILASAVITVARDRLPAGAIAEGFVEHVVNMIEEGMTDAIPVRRETLTQ